MNALNSLMSRLMKHVHSRRTEVLADAILPYIKKGERILDLGAGTGEIARCIKVMRNSSITLLDITNTYNRTDLPMETYDGEKIPYKINSFDTVLIIFVLHHCKDPDVTLREATRVSKNKIIIFEDVYRTKKDFFLVEIWHTLVSFLRGEELFFSFRSDEGWKRLFQKLHLKIMDTKEIRDPWYRPAKQRLYMLRKH